jgi:transcriptional regulator with XRE-family HTH domain
VVASVPSTYWRYRRSLGRELRGLREVRGLSGNQFAKELGWAQSKVSRIETGAQFPTESDLEVWCETLRLSKKELGELLSLLKRAESEYHNWKEHYRLAGGAAEKQQEILLFENQAKTICEFHPNLVPGLLQTKAYAEELLHLPFGPLFFGVDEASIQKMIVTRIQRQRIIYDPDKSVRIVVLESALLTRVCSVYTLYEQLLRLIDLCALRSLELGIVPLQNQLPIIPMGTYSIYDNHTVILETLSGEQQLSSAEEVNLYLSSFDAIAGVSLRGNSAATFLREAAKRVLPK